MTSGIISPITADVPGASSERNCALIRKTIRTVLALERVALPCEVDVLLTNDAGIHAINLEMRGVDMPTDVLSFPEFEFTPVARLRMRRCGDVATGLLPLGDMVLSMERVCAQAKEYGHPTAGSWPILLPILCSTCWATTIWMRVSRSGRCARAGGSHYGGTGNRKKSKTMTDFIKNGKRHRKETI